MKSHNSIEMKTFRIPIYITFTNWLIIVVIGSLLCPHIGQALTGEAAFGGSRNSAQELLGVSLICMVASALCSLPALILMFVAHLLLNKKEVSKKRHMLVQNLVHIGVSILTFGVMYLLVTDFGRHSRDVEFIGLLMLSYLPVGLIVWAITYGICKEKDVQIVKNGDVLDGF